MLHQKQFVRKTRKGAIQRVVREHYLRDDIPCGALPCAKAPATACDKESARLSPNNETILVIDTNVALHQIDLLENAAISNVVVLSVVLEEVKSRNVAVYGRLRALVAEESRRFFVFSNEHHKDTYIKAEPGESPNDRNDRAIRVAAQWYQQHLGGKVPVVLITDDKANLAKAVAGGTKAMRVREYVASLGSVELMDLVVSAGDGEEAEGGEGGEGDKAAREEENRGLRTNVSRSKRKRIYSDVSGQAEAERLQQYCQPLLSPDVPPCPFTQHKPMSAITVGLQRGLYHQGKLQHKPMSAITAGLQRGLYHQGKLRVSRYNCFEAFVGSESLGDEILVIGRCDMNRAVDGDVVAVELLPRDQWKEPTSGALREREDDHDDAAAEEQGEEDSVGLPPASADDAPSTLSSAAAALSLDKEGDGKEEGGGGGGGKDGGGGEERKGPSELARPTGRVVGIIKRNWRTAPRDSALTPPCPLSPATPPLSSPHPSSPPLLLPPCPPAMQVPSPPGAGVRHLVTAIYVTANRRLPCDSNLTLPSPLSSPCHFPSAFLSPPSSHAGSLAPMRMPPSSAGALVRALFVTAN
ncbi:unnamed protein product, partial [Closterium sp. NIES-64]